MIVKLVDWIRVYVYIDMYGDEKCIRTHKEIIYMYTGLYMWKNYTQYK